jgi:hypothetical protein
LSAGDGGLGGGDTHYHSYANNFTVSGAQSPDQTAGAIAKLWNSNPSLRPRF